MAEALSRATRIATIASQAWSCITSAPELFMHRENSVFKVQTDIGPAALRVHRHGYHNKAAISSEMQWMAELSRNGLQVPKPLTNDDGAFLCEIPYGGMYYLVDLLTWLDGVQLGNSTNPLAFGKGELQKIFFNLGSCIAKMHTVTDRWQIPQGFERHAWDREGFVGENAFWGRFWEASGFDDTGRRLLQLARDKAGCELGTLQHSGADYGLIHADFVRQNILVEGTDVRIIDFDDSGFGFRMYDFATALVKNRAEPHYETIKAALFEGYRSQHALSALDEKSLDFFLTLRDFAYLGWMDARRTEPGVESRMAKIRTETLNIAEAFLAARSVLA